jgi:hypothetical protein
MLAGSMEEACLETSWGLRSQNLPREALELLASMGALALASWEVGALVDRVWVPELRKLLG